LVCLPAKALRIVRVAGAARPHGEDDSDGPLIFNSSGNKILWTIHHRTFSSLET
jgi:hypothetical protein